MKDKQSDFDELMKRFDDRMKKFFAKAKRGRRILSEIQTDITRRTKQINRNK